MSKVTVIRDLNLETNIRKSNVSMVRPARDTRRSRQTFSRRNELAAKVVRPFVSRNHTLRCKDALRTAISTHPFANSTLISEPL